MRDSWYRRGFIALGALVAAVLLVIGGLYAAVNLWPDLGAQSAEALRGLIGERAVANLEMTALQIEDTLHTAISLKFSADILIRWPGLRRDWTDSGAVSRYQLAVPTKA